ncbi:MAG: LptF/LptG family permease [Brumimicrobium sp.]
MKKLSVFYIKSFIGPFMATFFISMFMLVMQFLWKYIDDLMGKGLEISIILELLFYVSASLLPLALPLAILLSSLIVMGNLGEHNELTALKSSGLSIYRILRPLSAVIIFIAIGTFYFSNYIIPIANYKWHSIIWDIQETKLTSFLKPGSYTQEIDGFSIKISQGKDNSFERIIIHDRRDPKVLKTIVADSGEFYRSENGEFLYFKLHHGNVIEELAEAPKFNDEKKKNKKSNHPGRKSTFSTATYKMNLTGFKLQRSQDDLFKNDYEMLNVFQIDKTVDSLKGKYRELTQTLTFNTKSKHEYFQALEYRDELKNDSLPDDMKTGFIKEKNKNKNKNRNRNRKKDNDTSKLKIDSIVKFYDTQSMTDDDKEKAYVHLKTQLRNKTNSLESQIKIENGKHESLRKFEIEFHRKFALSFSIIILFFIGAPLGAIVKKGGFGAPVVIAALLFMIYFVLISIGDNMAKKDIITPFMGMWGPNFILAPFAIFLMISAANDRSVVDFNKFWKRFKKNKDA